jgi:phosphoribosylaminoimidazole-succinocarboxamide synthase
MKIVFCYFSPRVQPDKPNLQESPIMKKINDLFQEIRASKDPQKELLRHSFGGLSDEQRGVFEKKDIKTYRGKIRDLIWGGEDRVTIIHSDRLTAFDCLIGMIPYKGVMLTAISDYWLSETKKVAPTHLIGSPDERVLHVEEATPFKIEVIVRGYMAGSMMRAYEKGEREFCGEKLPEGLKPFGRLPRPIITPTTKAAAFEHDENTTPDELIREGICTKKEWEEISSLALTVFEHGTRTCEEHGWILVDTKYEMGRTKDQTIKVIDEIHTPDSSRYWMKNTYDANLSRGQTPDMLDKEIVRRWLLEKGFDGHGSVPVVPADVLISLGEVYLGVAEKLIGKPLMSNGPDHQMDLETLVFKK